MSTLEQAVAVREKPILFSGPMVRAILDGRKTQTRRVVTNRNSEGNFEASELRLGDAWVDGSKLKAYLQPAVAERLGHGPDDVIERLYCRYQEGDRLWVREAFAWIGGPPSLAEANVWYAATDQAKAQALEDVDDPEDMSFRWSPSIHMPRWASRITLEITDVRVERVQSITNEDCEAEGLWAASPEYRSECCVWRESAAALSNVRRRFFAQLWDSLNAKRGYSWDVNPWVWVLSFRRIAA